MAVNPWFPGSPVSGLSSLLSPPGGHLNHLNHPDPPPPPIPPDPISPSYLASFPPLSPFSSATVQSVSLPVTSTGMAHKALVTYPLTKGNSQSSSLGSKKASKLPAMGSKNPKVTVHEQCTRSISNSDSLLHSSTLISSIVNAISCSCPSLNSSSIHSPTSIVPSHFSPPFSPLLPVNQHPKVPPNPSSVPLLKAPSTAQSLPSAQSNVHVSQTSLVSAPGQVPAPGPPHAKLPPNLSLIEKIRKSQDKALHKIDSYTISESGKRRISIPDAVYDRGAAEHKEFLVGYFLGKAPAYSQIQNVLNHLSTR